MQPHRCPIREWSLRPDSMLPAFTIDIVRGALADAPRLRWQHPEIFVQGSYANQTNIAKHRDVDLVIQLPMPFDANIDRLDADEREQFYRHYGHSDYEWEDFREDVKVTLRRSFFVRDGKRCLTIRDWDNLLRIPADILVATEYRRYTAFPDLLGEVYDEGVFFRTRDLTPIVNYPKLHLKNGNAKDRNTSGRFKQVVRAVKNARLQDPDEFDPSDAPSYFVECLLYNVPNRRYRGDLENAYRSVVGWLEENTGKLSSMRCQNGIIDMFGHHPEAWSQRSAERLISTLAKQCKS